MAKSSKYKSKTPDKNGIIHYTDEENQVWHDLITTQLPMLPDHACDEYIQAMHLMDFPHDRVPQLHEINEVLMDYTGWSVYPVPALIDFPKFFSLLANRQFPAATFIRSREEMEYLQEPDVFHELFGHTPMLTDYRFAAFSEAYGKAGVKADKRDQAMLARLYWFTVEFGLIRAADGVRAYGAGIVSSPGELVYALDSDVPIRKPLDPVDALRTPYRIDIYQTVYFIINHFDELFELAQKDLIGLVKQARKLGMHAPTFPVKDIA
ncbi:MAG: phenylalanine 4-monooxygenase [Xanthomonadales bacterium]|nr:phenylalanine 4-monooxygenase [Xanthomonadales bacterium]